MSRQSPFGHPFLLGFDEIEQALDRVAKAAGDGYPPYNIERLARTEHAPERLRITLAVAGFTRDQLEVTLEESQLVIRGRQTDDKTRHFLHRGIAARQFQRTFLLAESMEVLGADLSPDRHPRQGQSVTKPQDPWAPRILPRKGEGARQERNHDQP